MLAIPLTWEPASYLPYHEFFEGIYMQVVGALALMLPVMALMVIQAPAKSKPLSAGSRRRRPAVAARVTREIADAGRWSAMKNGDPDLSAAAREIAHFGAGHEADLAAEYLHHGARGFLGPLMQRINRTILICRRER